MNMNSIPSYRYCHNITELKMGFCYNGLISVEESIANKTENPNVQLPKL